MSETSNTIPPKGINSLSKSDIWKSILVVLFPHIVAMVKFLISSDHWPTWPEWQPYVEISVLTLLTYLGKNFKTNNVGELFQPNKPTVTVPAKELEKVIDIAQEKIK